VDIIGGAGVHQHVVKSRSPVKTKCVKIRLKPDCLDRVHTWAAEVNARSEEALATLHDEGVALESVFLDRNSEGDFLIYYMRALDFAAASEVVKSSEHSIDAFHAQFKEDCWESGQQLRLLVNLENHLLIGAPNSGPRSNVTPSPET